MDENTKTVVATFRRTFLAPSKAGELQVLSSLDPYLLDLLVASGVAMTGLSPNPRCPVTAESLDPVLNCLIQRPSAYRTNRTIRSLDFLHASEAWEFQIMARIRQFPAYQSSGAPVGTTSRAGQP